MSTQKSKYFYFHVMTAQYFSSFLSRTDMTFLSPRVSARLDEAKKEFRHNLGNGDGETTVPKSLTVLSLSSDS